MAIRRPLISKSKFLNGVQCLKLLWHACHTPETIPPVDSAKQALFDQGIELNHWAQSLFDSGSSVNWDAGFQEGLDATRQALSKGKPIFEAGFLVSDLFARVDVLLPAESGRWAIVEVKSSTQVKDEHIDDVAFQKWVCESAGLTIAACELALIDTTYVRNGPIDAHRLIKRIDITKAVTARAATLPDRIGRMRESLRTTQSPDVPIGPHCMEPYPCPLKPKCWANVPANSVFTLKNGRALAGKLWAEGIRELKDIPQSQSLSPQQLIQIECEKSGGQMHADPDQIRAFLNLLVYPIHVLDFETLNPGIPVYDGSRPYEQIPFQFSLHIQSSPDQEASCAGYLHDGRTDPRPRILQMLKKEIRPEGSILAYNAKFEIGVLDGATNVYADYRSWFDEILPRFVDVYQPFKSFHYYHPDQLGSASLKAVYPALVGDAGYTDLQIRDGATASQEFCRVTFRQSAPDDVRAVRRALEAYCCQDTEGLIQVIRALEKLASPQLRA